MTRCVLIIGFLVLGFVLQAQNLVYRDTTPAVFENGVKLKMPWAGGINFASFTPIDLNADGKLDLAAFDKISGSGGKLRTYLNVGGTGEANYLHSFTYQEDFPAVTDWALFFDYNYDGKADLFTYTTGGIKVFKNTSNGATLSFQLEKSLLRSNYNPGGPIPNYSNIPVITVGIPGIADLDNDGDLDILTFSYTGVRVEFHKNMSQEKYGVADSLVFDMVDNCWGDFQESSCMVDLNMCPFMKQYQQAIEANPNKVLHAGSCIMCFDRDGDGDQELLLGDVSCNHPIFVSNEGSASNAHIGDTTALYPNYPNKASTNVIRFNTFPCSYHLDINNDGAKDLIVTPNSISGAENYQSVWYYQNTSTTPTVNFVYQQNNFLQDNMIELGEGAYPVLFDADADGKKDLIIGNLGYFTVNTNKSKLAYYKNIGTNASPSFSLITRDYQNLSSYNIFSMAPTFGDLDGDGDQDLIIGGNNGRVHYFENTAGAGNAAVFSNYTANYQNILGNNLVYPQLFDVDNNGTLDLLLGSLNGKLIYYQNIGTTTTPTFTLVSNNFGNVDVRQLSIGATTGYSTPYMYRDAGVTKLLVGCEVGSIYLYNNIDGNLNGTFQKVDTMLYGINEGTRSAPCYEDITSDGKRDLLVGNYSGGVAFFNSTNVSMVNVKETFYENEVVVFPNPANQVVNISINNHQIETLNISCVDMLGKTIKQWESQQKNITLNVSSFNKGIYFILISNPSGVTISKKIIID